MKTGGRTDAERRKQLGRSDVSGHGLGSLKTPRRQLYEVRSLGLMLTRETNTNLICTSKSRPSGHAHLPPAPLLAQKQEFPFPRHQQLPCRCCFASGQLCIWSDSIRWWRKVSPTEPLAAASNDTIQPPCQGCHLHLVSSTHLKMSLPSVRGCCSNKLWHRAKRAGR